MMLSACGPNASWNAIEEHHLEKSFLFPDFAKALAFVMRIGAVAEEEGHHPDLGLSWGKVDVKIEKTASMATMYLYSMRDMTIPRCCYSGCCPVRGRG